MQQQLSSVKMEKKERRKEKEQGWKNNRGKADTRAHAHAFVSMSECEWA